MRHAPAMLRQLIGATAIVVVFAETRFRPADYPTTDIYWSSGYGSNLSSENRWREAEEEQKYREAVKRIPDRKASSDP
jgi:hypothetical protein